VGMIIYGGVRMEAEDLCSEDGWKFGGDDGM